MNEFLHHYREIVTDLPHLAAEVTFVIVIDVVFLGIVWPFMKRRWSRALRREHAAIDAEHGVTHVQRAEILTAPAGLTASAIRSSATNRSRSRLRQASRCRGSRQTSTGSRPRSTHRRSSARAR